jgi:hypothetical protein
LEQRLAAACERARELTRRLSRYTMDTWRAVWEDQLKAVKGLAAARGVQ